MRNADPAASILVGYDGSRASSLAAVWAVDEAVHRDIPVRLVYVVDPADGRGADVDDQLASARAALSNGQRMLQSIEKPVKVETEIAHGRPVATLVEASRWATMVCVGSLGIAHARRSDGTSVAAALAGSASCPVAVIGASADRHVAETGWIVVGVDESPDIDEVLRWAFEKARLRAAPLRVIAWWRVEVPDDIGGESRLAQAQLNRRIIPWMRLYADVHVEPLAVRGGVSRYLATNAKSVQLVVADDRGVRNMGRQNRDQSSMLIVRRNHL